MSHKKHNAAEPNILAGGIAYQTGLRAPEFLPPVSLVKRATISSKFSLSSVKG
jgi:hypothetical protein